jgi:hypothetical protein
VVVYLLWQQEGGLVAKEHVRGIGTPRIQVVFRSCLFGVHLSCFQHEEQVVTGLKMVGRERGVDEKLLPTQQ